MDNTLETIISKISDLDPMHGKKLRKNLRAADPSYFARANAFLGKYTRFLANTHKDLDYGIDCYLKVNIEMVQEQHRFLKTGEYRHTSFEEVKERVYDNPEIMEYRMHGLLLSQFLWAHHYKMFSFFIRSLPDYQKKISRYLEIGGGHGLYISEAISVLGENTHFDFVDISEHSLKMAKRFIESESVHYICGDIFDFAPDYKYDFIAMGEVLEHVEKPLELLHKLHDLLNEGGTLFIVVPANAPTIDHISLFRSAEEIRTILKRAHFKIVNQVEAFAEDVPRETAEKYKVALVYGAFVEKENVIAGHDF